MLQAHRAILLAELSRCEQQKRLFAPQTFLVLTTAAEVLSDLIYNVLRPFRPPLNDDSAKK